MIVESFETEKLKKLIEDKKRYLAKQTNKTASQFLQAEIMLLERDILPCVEVGTQLLNDTYCRYFNKALDVAIRFNCDGLLVYTPLKPDIEFPESPQIGIFNSKDGCENPGDVFVEIFNMDINGRAVKPINLHLNALV